MTERITGIIVQMIRENGTAKISRNELAARLGCVPSQISYVIASRFGPEQGFVVESRRGGRGYIRITKINSSGNQAIMGCIRSIGDTLDNTTARACLQSLHEFGSLSEREGNLILQALSDNTLCSVPQNERDSLRATLFKAMLTVLADNA
jgi:transcriptional regulator CtsR